MKRGYIQVYTGNGKGKTTAAIGLAIRAAGAGFKVYFAQFLKGRRTSEHKSLRKFKNQITVKNYGKKSFIIGLPSKADILMVNIGLEEVRKSIQNRKYDLVILDEINNAIDLKIIKLQQIVDLLKKKPDSVEIVMTGRNAPAEILKIADLVTEMREIKHYFKSNVKARTGIEK